MTSFKEITKELEKFGLSENQALIYLFLVQHGELRIQEISNETQIPRSSVYENLKVLLELGLVEKVIDQKFTRIKPYPVGSLRHGLNEKLLHLQTLTADLEDLEKSIESLPDVKLPSTVIRYYKGISGARQLFWNSLNAKSTVYVYSAFGRSKFVGKKFYMDFVEQSREKNIKEMVLINPTSRALKLIKRDIGSPLARTNIKDIRFLKEKKLPIKGETFIYDNIYAQINLDAMEINGFEIESHNFTKPQMFIFKTLWDMAKPISFYLNK